MTDLTRKNDIIIDISNLKDAQPIDAESQIYIHQIKQAIEHIEKALSQLSFEKQNKTFDDEETVWKLRRRHLNLGILGRRGAGKTSFLHSLIRLLDDKDQKDELDYRKNYSESLVKLEGEGTEINSEKRIASEKSKLDEISGKISICGLVEPAMMQKKDNIVSTIFADLNYRAQQCLNKKICQLGRDVMKEKSDKFRTALAKVIKQLPVTLNINRLEKAFNEYDTEGMLEETMQFRSGYNLERALWEFIDVYLDLVGKEMAVIAIDDVDMSFNRGEEVLESLRRYLTSNKMLIMVTGDIEMYSQTLKNSFSRQLRRGLINLKSETSHHFLSEDSFIEDLTHQYLKKLLPPHMRVYLPDMIDMDFDRIFLKIKESIPRNERRAIDQTQENTGNSEMKNVIAFKKDYFNSVLRDCLRIEKACDDFFYADLEFLFNIYRFLIPRDVRRFIYFCLLETERVVEIKNKNKSGNYNGKVQHQKELKRKNNLLIDMFHNWRGNLELNQLSPQELKALIKEDRVGLFILNFLLTNEMSDESMLRLDARTDSVNVNLILAFFRFAVEANLDGRSVPGIISLGLDLCVPGYYLMSLPSDERSRQARHLQLNLKDSQRQLYARLVPWVARKANIKPGVVKLCDRPGALENLLDINDPSPRAGWRKILGNPERRNLTRYRKEMRTRCNEFLTPKRDYWADRSCFKWSSEYLPGVFQKDEITDLFILNEEEAKLTRLVNEKIPKIPEMATSPDFFDRLAGALPRLLLNCWTTSEGGQTYLNCWNGLSIVKEVIRLAANIYEKITDITQIRKKDLFKIIYRKLKTELEPTAGAWAPFEMGMAPPSPPPPKEKDEYDELGEYWKKITEEIDAASDPADFYPLFKNNKAGLGLAWHKFPDPEWIDDDKKIATNPGVGFSKDNCITIQDRNDLESCRKQAWDQTLKWLGAAVTEWVAYWGRHWYSKNRCKPNFNQIQKTIETFLEDIGDEESYVGQWSGAGDIIQRWIYHFLNSVLIETLEYKSTFDTDDCTCRNDGEKPAEEEPEEKKEEENQAKSKKKEKGRSVERPSLQRSSVNKKPPRAANESEGAYHPLYQNLKYLQSAIKTKSLWKWSDTFLALASFPTIGCFLHWGGPLDDDMEIRKILKKHSDQGEFENVNATVYRKDGNNKFACFMIAAGEDSGKRTHVKSIRINKDFRIRQWNKIIEHINGDLKKALNLALLVCFGSLPLISLDPLDRLDGGRILLDDESSIVTIDECEKKDATISKKVHSLYYPLELMGLSWCGLDVRYSEVSNDRQSEAIRDIEQRRKALIAMLNCLVADIKPYRDAEKYLNHLAMAVKGSIDDKILKTKNGSDSSQDVDTNKTEAKRSCQPKEKTE